MEQRFLANDVAPVRIESRDGGRRVISGHAAVWYDKRNKGTEYRLTETIVERVKPGAFDDALGRSDSDPVALFNHDTNVLLGREANDTLRLDQDKKGLRYEIDYDGDDPDHQRVAAKIQRGDLAGSSFSFSIDEGGVDWVEEGNIFVRMILKVARLFDVGPVVTPAYSATDAGMRSDGLRSPDLEEIQKALESWKQGRRASRRAELLPLMPISKY